MHLMKPKFPSPIMLFVLVFIFIERTIYGASGAAADTSLCESAVKAAAQDNAMALFRGAEACAQDDNETDATFLLVVGQIRALSDMTILQPADDESKLKAGELYRNLYYNYGGMGPDEFYRKSTQVDALVKKVNNTDLTLNSNYDPGWRFRSSSKTDIYPQIIESNRARRIWQINNTANRLQNDEYYALYRAERDLRKRNPVYKQGTPAYAEAERLMALMRKIEQNIQLMPEPKLNIPHERLNEQDPELAKRQLYSDFNGPGKGDNEIFRSEDEVRKSWIAKSLNKEQLVKLLANVDFSKQVLLASSFGERMNASGSLMFSELGYSTLAKGYVVAKRIGVVPQTCGRVFAKSYPFIIGVTDSIKDAKITASSSSNFPDGCKQIMTGMPASPQ